MFPSRLSEVTIEEVQNVIYTEAAEGYDFELKRSLAGKKGCDDPWMSGGKLGDEAKDALAKEIVAFANTGGGTLIIGIDEETATKRARPPIFPVPHCKEAATRLHQAIGDRIEPKLPMFECEGVVTEDDGSSGVIIMRTLQSYLAPHRHTQDNHCYIRRNDRAEPMSMQEIQALALRSGRRLERLDATFVASSDRFYRWVPQRFCAPDPERGVQGQEIPMRDTIAWTDVWGLRITAVPLTALPTVDLPRSLWLPLLNPQEHFNGPGVQGRLWCRHIEAMHPWVPRLRAVERQTTGEGMTILDRITTEGLVERFLLMTSTQSKRDTCFLDLVELHWHITSVIRIADTARAETGRPGQAFALEIEYGSSDVRVLYGYRGNIRNGTLPERHTVFPRLEIGTRESFNDILTTVDRDVWNMCGIHPNWELAIDWPPSVPQRA